MKTAFKILVPIDFSDLSKEAFFVACDIAKRLQGRLLILHVVDYVTPSLFFAEGMVPPESHTEFLDFRIAKEKQLEELMEDERARGLWIHPIFTTGVPTEEIVERARRHKADLIVMSTHGRTGISHFLLGSVAEGVIRKAPCPVLTLNPAVLSHMKKEELSPFDMERKEIMQ